MSATSASARDPAALAEFYRDVLGLEVVGGSTADTSALGATAFLSSHPAEVSLDLALFANPAYQHTAFEVRSLAVLRALHQRVLGRGMAVKLALNHGASLAFYFDDPEGHLVEVYWPTGVACRPPYGDPIDLTLSEEALRRDVAELAARGRPIRGQRRGTGRAVVTLPEEQQWAPAGFGNRARVLVGRCSGLVDGTRRATYRPTIMVT